MDSVGCLVEELIHIKDRMKDKLYETEIDALNNACNLIYYNFDPDESCYDIIERGREERDRKRKDHKRKEK